MSIDYSVYLGPYLQCEYELVQTQRFKKICHTEDCPTYNSPTSDPNKHFCGICGQPLIDIPEAIEEPGVDPWQLAEEIVKALMHIPLEGSGLGGRFHIWVPNVKRNPPRKFHYDPHYDLCIVSLGDTSNHLGEVIWFTEAFLKEIKVLKKHYKECLGQWGLIIYVY